MTKPLIQSSFLILLTQAVVTFSLLPLSLAVQANEARSSSQDCQDCKLENALVTIAQADQRTQAKLLNEEGYKLFNQGQFQAALDKFERALVILRAISDLAGEGEALNGIGATHYGLGQYAKAIEFNQRAVTIFRETGNRTGEGRTLSNVGRVYHNLGQYAKALDYYQQSLVILKEIRDLIGEGRILSNIGSVYRSLGQDTKALDYYQQALGIHKEVGDRAGTGGTLNGIGSVYRSLGQDTKALDYYQQALGIHKEVVDRASEGSTLSGIGSVYKSLRQDAKALDYYQQALLIHREMGDRVAEGATLHTIGTLYHNPDRYGKALDYYQQALVIHQETGNRSLEGTTLNNIGAIYAYFGTSAQLPLAEKHLVDAIRIEESLRLGLRESDKIPLIDAQMTVYHLLQYVLSQQQKYAQALEISERSRTRAFVELLSQRLPTTFQNSLPSPPSIKDIQRIAQQQQATLIQYTTIVDPRFKKPELYIWVISPAGKLDFRKVDLSKDSNKNLSQQVQAAIAVAQTGFRDSNTRSFSVSSLQPGMRVYLKDDIAGWEPWIILHVDPQKQEIRVKNLNVEEKTIPVTLIARIDQSSLQTLYQMLIQPIADLLPTDPNQRIIFIPVSELFNVPFAALMDEQGKYLIQKHTLLTAPSIQTLDLTRQQRQRIKLASSQSAIVVGNPTMPKVSLVASDPATQLSKLPFAETEAKEIASLLNTTAITGNAATKANLLSKLPNARIIHLATHGLLDDYKGDAIPGAIALAPSDSDDGLLRSRDILDLKLNAELVVLSACDTGKGKITGDGVLGLSRSLFVAGTPSVIVSLWQVNDSSTAELMTAFYRHWQKTGDKAVALRQAMLDTMQKYPDPKDWAAFTLIGEAE